MKKECYPDFELGVVIHCFPVIRDYEIKKHICECRALEVQKAVRTNRFSGKKIMVDA